MLLLSWYIFTSECYIRVFHYKVIVLLESIDQWNHFSALLQFAVSIDCSLEYQFIFIELSLHSSLLYAFYYAGIFDAGLE